MNLEKEVGDILSRHYWPTSVLINQFMEIVEYRGKPHFFLQHRAGEATLNILNMLPPQVATVLQEMVISAGKTELPIERNGLEMNLRGFSFRFSLQVFPLKPENDQKYFFVVFNDTNLPQPYISAPTPGFIQHTEQAQHKHNHLPAPEKPPEIAPSKIEQSGEAMENERAPKPLHEKKLRKKFAALQEENHELKVYNDELLQLAYVSSHDLQEPLRKIITYSDLMISRLRQLMPADGIDYAEKIFNAARHMSRLINDLLDYTHISRTPEKFEKTDLGSTMKKVLEEFEPVIRAKNAKVELAQLPVADVVPRQMEQLFHNLVSNALKFTHDQRNPEIVIMSKKLSDRQLIKYGHRDKPALYYHITVSDNGIGFRQQYANRIFTIFQRLHSKEDFAGTGIGLALCRKIMMNHKGGIYATSKENEGTTMHVVLPAKQPSS